MSDPVQLAPMLSIYEDDGEITMRTSDSPISKQVSAKVISLIQEMAKPRKVTLITPTDTKVFKFAPAAQTTQSEPSAPPTPPIRARERIVQDESAPPAPEIADEFEKELQEQEKAEAEIKEEANVEEMPVRKRAKQRPEPSSELQSTCGRCFGTGALEGGGACPVCRGKGSIAHYGRRGR